MATRVGVAGATGSAGAAVIEHLLQQYPDIAIRGSYFQTKPFLRDPRIEYVKGDLRHGAACEALIRDCDYIVMTAASTGGVGYTASAPWRHVNDNTIMNSQMLEAIASSHVSRYVLVLSATLYQRRASRIREEQLDYRLDPDPGHFAFGWANRYIEKLARFTHDRFGKKIVLLRTANIFGPYSRFDPMRSNFIPALIRKASDRMDPFEIWGDPRARRDVIFSKDFASAVVTALFSDLGYDVFNVGSGRSVSVAHVAEIALRVFGHRPRDITRRNGTAWATRPRVLDVSKIGRRLGWRPQHSIEDGIIETCKWWRDNRKRWRR